MKTPSHTHVLDTGIKNGTHDFSSPFTNPYSIESAHLAQARRDVAKMKPLHIAPTPAQAERIARGRTQRTGGQLPWPSHGGPR
jgi:hypothetical protein